MDLKIVRFEEGTDYDPNRGFYRFKRAVFTVNGTQHTIKISMPDFEADKASSIVEAEARKIAKVLEGIGSGSGKAK